jgi:hypothetical protein
VTLDHRDQGADARPDQPRHERADQAAALREHEREHPADPPSRTGCVRPLSHRRAVPSAPRPAEAARTPSV